MNNELHFSSKGDEWSTPQDFYNKLDAKYKFVFDLAASKKNCKTEDGFTKEENALEQNWALITDYQFVKGRLKFGNSKNAAPFPSMLIKFDLEQNNII